MQNSFHLFLPLKTSEKQPKDFFSQMKFNKIKVMNFNNCYYLGLLSLIHLINQNNYPCIKNATFICLASSNQN